MAEAPAEEPEPEPAEPAIPWRLKCGQCQHDLELPAKPIARAGGGWPFSFCPGCNTARRVGKMQCLGCMKAMLA
eukprot:9075098-Prorocentrum_lima.AAC.1